MIICYYALDLVQCSTSQTLFDVGSDILKINLIHPFLKQYTVLIQVDTMIWKAMKPN